MFDKNKNSITQAIFDGEIIAYDFDKKISLPFNCLQSLKESNNDNCKNFKILIFDVLIFNNEDIRKKILIQRKYLLKDLQTSPRVDIIEYTTVGIDRDLIPTIEKIFEESKKNHNEGLMIKVDSSLYIPGSRTYWIKLKFLNLDRKETVDLVIVGGYIGTVKLLEKWS